MIIFVSVKAGSREEKIISIDSSHYIVQLTARAESGKANLALLKLLRRHFKKHIKIIKGKQSRKKVIEIID